LSAGARAAQWWESTALAYVTQSAFQTHAQVTARAEQLKVRLVSTGALATRVSSLGGQSVSRNPAASD